MAGQRYSVMPMPAIEEHTEYVEAGPLTFGIEYRVLEPKKASEYSWERVPAHGEVDKPATPKDAGVTIHVYETPGRIERLRFDCFLEDPHYHYINHREKINEFWTLDPFVTGAPLPWALNVLKSRLVPMLARASAGELAERVTQAGVDRALPRVAELAEAARTLGLPAGSREGGG